ncbi:MAG: CPBP family intramembrane metalloprotease [Planctomycetaceae bacterium]|nr:CPBP family intramembrane metalloprotease [Planctomycetaceae bacterium]
MQSFDLPRILLQFVVLLPIAASLYLWFRYLSKAERPFWRQPRPFDLPRHSSTLLLTGGLMIFGNALVQTAFLPDVLDRYAPTVEKTHEEITGKEFGIERELVQTQFSVVVNLAFAGLALIVIFLQPGNDRKRVGFRGDDLPRQAWYGLQGFLLAILPVYALVLLVLPLKESEEAVHPLLRMMAEGQFNNRYVFWACLSAIVVAPIQEEILYRVLLQEGMVSLGYRWQYVIPGVAVFFSLMHLFPDMIPLFPLAMLFGLVMHFRNSFLAVVLMHMLFNAFNILLTLISNPS